MLDAMVGQDALSTSVAFRDGVGFTGVVLSEAGRRRAVSRPVGARRAGAPILRLTGLDVTSSVSTRIAWPGASSNMGDILTLIEQAEKKMDAEESEGRGQAMAGELTLSDFNQLQQIKKLGSMKKMPGMIPGTAQLGKDQIDNFG